MEEKENRHRRSHETREQKWRNELQKAQIAHHEEAMRQQYLRVRKENCWRRYASRHEDDPTQWEVTITQLDPEDTDQWCVVGNRQ